MAKQKRKNKKTKQKQKKKSESDSVWLPSFYAVVLNKHRQGGHPPLARQSFVFLSVPNSNLTNSSMHRVPCCVIVPRGWQSASHERGQPVLRDLYANLIFKKNSLEFFTNMRLWLSSSTKWNTTRRTPVSSCNTRTAARTGTDFYLWSTRAPYNGREMISTWRRATSKNKSWFAQVNSLTPIGYFVMLFAPATECWRSTASWFPAKRKRTSGNFWFKAKMRSL